MASRVRNKTRKAVAKRFKVTAKGKVLRRKATGRHILEKKSAKRKRGLRKAVVLPASDEARVKENLPFA